ncbi:uncharacterized protein BDZ99DRAFT_526680 [Mytilinidion resinicola]|uniref:Chromo domain-containing protein n=1 Tax=Mytilinidion resinicola TaxID=574789 RepID=A0A6A6Y467_9PEZI|nr:uncharacterized protein BDZ99DRAFT_526680 [Mytilinidion resinicola]KAF2803313.1 hypothetical protein BDZ99DRAFT_526680 [Mytilinidion resinicola]
MARYLVNQHIVTPSQRDSLQAELVGRMQDEGLSRLEMSIDLDRRTFEAWETRIFNEYDVFRNTDYKSKNHIKRWLRYLRKTKCGPPQLQEANKANSRRVPSQGSISSSFGPQPVPVADPLRPRFNPLNPNISSSNHAPINLPRIRLPPMLFPKPPRVNQQPIALPLVHKHVQGQISTPASEVLPTNGLHREFPPSQSTSQHFASLMNRPSMEQRFTVSSTTYPQMSFLTPGNLSTIRGTTYVSEVENTASRRTGVVRSVDYDRSRKAQHLPEASQVDIIQLSPLDEDLRAEHLIDQPPINTLSIDKPSIARPSIDQISSNQAQIIEVTSDTPPGLPARGAPPPAKRSDLGHKTQGPEFALPMKPSPRQWRSQSMPARQGGSGQSTERVALEAELPKSPPTEIIASGSAVPVSQSQRNQLPGSQPCDNQLVQSQSTSSTTSSSVLPLAVSSLSKGPASSSRLARHATYLELDTPCTQVPKSSEMQLQIYDLDRQDLYPISECISLSDITDDLNQHSFSWETFQELLAETELEYSLTHHSILWLHPESRTDIRLRSPRNIKSAVEAYRRLGHSLVLCGFFETPKPILTRSDVRHVEAISRCSLTSCATPQPSEEGKETECSDWRREKVSHNAFNPCEMVMQSSGPRGDAVAGLTAQQPSEGEVFHLAPALNASEDRGLQSTGSAEADGDVQKEGQEELTLEDTESRDTNVHSIDNESSDGPLTPRMANAEDSIAIEDPLSQSRTGSQQRRSLGSENFLSSSSISQSSPGCEQQEVTAREDNEFGQPSQQTCGNSELGSAGVSLPQKRDALKRRQSPDSSNHEAEGERRDKRPRLEMSSPQPLDELRDTIVVQPASGLVRDQGPSQPLEAPSVQMPCAIEIEDDIEYEIQDIVEEFYQRRGRGKAKIYSVKWKEFALPEDTDAVNMKDTEALDRWEEFTRDARLADGTLPDGFRRELQA